MRGRTSGAANINYMPPANTATNTYTFTITETQGANSISMVSVMHLNMLDMNGQLTYGTTANTLCRYAIQDFINCAIFPYAGNVFTVKPQSISIKSDNPYNQYGNTSSVVPFSNANQTFNTVIMLTYPSPFGSFTLNALNNPLMQTSITQTALTWTLSNTTPSTPNTREVANLSAWDQQFYTLIPTDTENPQMTMGFTALLNGYVANPSSALFSGNNPVQLYMPLSNYRNPTIFLTNISVAASAANHYATIDNFMPATLNSLTSATYRLYLANTNASLYTFQIYQGSGYGAYNYTMLVQEGTSPSSAITVQTYKITAVPFALPLQNGEQYRFLFYNLNGSLEYTSALSIWPQTITIYLPNNSTAPAINVPALNANCIIGTNSISGAEWVLTNFQDTKSIITSWNISLQQQSIMGSQTLVSNIILSSSGAVNFTLPNSTKAYYIVDTAIWGQSKTVVISCAVNQYVQKIPTASYGLMAFFLFLVMVFSAGNELRGAIVMGTIAIVFEVYTGLSTLTLDGLIVIIFISAAVIWWIRNKKGE